MSWIATKYAWRCTNPAVKGSVRLVLLAIALRVEKQKLKTTPTSLRQLERLTLLDGRSVRRCLDVLCSVPVGEVARVSRGKGAVYELSKMAGPLFVVRSEKPDKMSGFVVSDPGGKTGQDVRKKPDKMSGKNRTRCPVSAGGDPISVLSTRVRTSSTTEKGAAAVASRMHAHEFIEWWVATYPVYNDGAQSTIDDELHGPMVAELLERRSVERLRAMAVALWIVDAREDSWIAGSDRSIRVLRHKADWLDHRLTTVAEWWLACPHTPKCGAWADCGAAQAVRA